MQIEIKTTFLFSQKESQNGGYKSKNGRLNILVFIIPLMLFHTEFKRTFGFIDIRKTTLSRYFVYPTVASHINGVFETRDFNFIDRRKHYTKIKLFKISVICWLTRGKIWKVNSCTKIKFGRNIIGPDWFDELVENRFNNFGLTILLISYNYLYYNSKYFYVGNVSMIFCFCM